MTRPFISMRQILAIPEDPKKWSPLQKDMIRSLKALKDLKGAIRGHWMGKECNLDHVYFKWLGRAKCEPLFWIRDPESGEFTRFLDGRE